MVCGNNAGCERAGRVEGTSLRRLNSQFLKMQDSLRSTYVRWLQKRSKQQEKSDKFMNPFIVLTMMSRWRIVVSNGEDGEQAVILISQAALIPQEEGAKAPQKSP